ncbi:helix-turn-helix domain-containing protein [Amycolatopsis magusensis]|uniref:Transcriptional regulator with XRE-family HTH domain n=1 Tax=Amycolatopsis magusensis TaxID=882444 RepID=A0ABS4PPN0_9PSEU|nr:helix-turn-helix transcriptional regulator [Amycolatopsis magusensis]MBP2181365.1 transcriptional regulator with XRE-family HTH domain [Amycolatopsis magusensis]MDI5975163.1 helix-turn-helix transcriptional regulator [Amycolatopsis magusensis]
MEPATELGRRLREIRGWRQLSLRAVAQLSGYSFTYLGQIERGEKPVNSRRVLEALARTLRVSPTELTGKPYVARDPVDDDIRAGVPEVEAALTGWWVGEVPEEPVRPWPQVTADVRRLNKVLRPDADFAAQVVLIPRLIRELLVVSADPAHRREALIGLIGTYKAAAYLVHDLGFAGLPALAVERMHQAAERLDDPVWTTYAAYQRAQLLSGANRQRQYELAVRVAEMPGGRTETAGLAHLTAALASATRGQAEQARTHLAEAAALAGRLGPDVSPWMDTNFGRTNVGIWQVTIGLELGLGAGVAELAREVRPVGVSRARQSAYWMDLGRGLLTERKTREQGLSAMLKAEELAPQKVRNNVFAREAVADLLGSARRDAGGRELRGLAWRMGVAPTG